MARLLWLAPLILTQATFAAAQDFPADRIVGGVSGDWNRDGKSDLALLVSPGEGETYAGLYLYLGDSARDLLRPAAAVKDFVWGDVDLDGLYGQDPTLEALSNGSLAIHTLNESIGRERWRSTLTVAWRDGRFVIAGFTLDWRDTLDPDSLSHCDYNVLTGKYVLDEKARATEARTIALNDWDDAIARRVCGLD